MKWPEMGWRYRQRRGRRGRLPKPISIGVIPPTTKFTPSPQGTSDPLYLEPAELEALRLVDLEGLSQEEAGAQMGVSRGTMWRLIQSGRKKTAQALSEGRPIHIASASKTPRTLKQWKKKAKLRIHKAQANYKARSYDFHRLCSLARDR